MIEVHRHIVLVALHDLLGKHRLLGSCIIAILETVALLVSLCYNIHIRTCRRDHTSVDR